MTGALMTTAPVAVEGLARPLTGRVALVTGGAQGIGRAIAIRLAQAGARVAINDVPEKASQVEGVIEEMIPFADNGNRFKCPALGNVSDPVQVREVVAKVRKDAGRLDILVNNAGINRDAPLVKLTDEMWDLVMQVDLYGPYYCLKAVVPGMIENSWGRVINLSSIVGRTGNYGQPNYSAAKAGLLGLTMTVAREVAKYGITVNAVCPGFIETDMTAKIREDIKDMIIKRIPVRRMGLPEEVAHVVSFLADPMAAYITGAAIDVNGGDYM